MGTAYSQPWDKGLPVTLRLPRDGYQNNPDVVALLSQPDEFLTAKKLQLETLYEQLRGETAPEEWLDYVAWLMGWSSEYWDSRWSESVKRQLIVIANSVWGRLGQSGVITEILDIHGIEHDLWTEVALQLPFSMPAVFSTPKGRLYIRLPIQYLRNGNEFREARRTRDNFVPCTILSGVVYDRFYLGISQLGDPMFSS